LGEIIWWPEGFNFDELKPEGGLHEKQAVSTGNLGTVSELAWRQRKTVKTCVTMADRRTFRMHTDI
jgi:hypothetical protein